MNDPGIVLPAVLVIGLAVGLAVFSIIGMERAANNFANAANAAHQQSSTNWSALLIAMIVAAFLLGAVGIGPFAEVVSVVPLR
jgi:uncharacterized membrane protein YjgN (DUF898 family)